MFDLVIASNVHILTREMQSWATLIPSRQDKAVRKAAQEFVKDCKVEIDNLIYSKPPSDTYSRTGNLRRSHKFRRIAEGVYLIENVAPYAIYQHDGWRDPGGHWHQGRPWMDTALAKNQEKYAQIIDEAISGLFGGK